MIRLCLGLDALLGARQMIIPGTGYGLAVDMASGYVIAGTVLYRGDSWNAELGLDLARTLGKPALQLLLGRDGDHTQHRQRVSVGTSDAGVPSRYHDDPVLSQGHVVGDVVVRCRAPVLGGPEARPQVRHGLVVNAKNPLCTNCIVEPPKYVLIWGVRWILARFWPRTQAVFQVGYDLYVFLSSAVSHMLLSL